MVGFSSQTPDTKWSSALISWSGVSHRAGLWRGTVFSQQAGRKSRGCLHPASHRTGLTDELRQKPWRLIAQEAEPSLHRSPPLLSASH